MARPVSGRLSRAGTGLTFLGSALASLALGFAAMQAHAGARPGEAHRLEEDLTPLGAQRAGNQEGTIPQWAGGLKEPPAGYREGEVHADPFAGDEPLFRITAQNLSGHAARLSPGQRAMFEAYPDTYFMDVYPSRRSATFPLRVYARTAANAASGALAENGEGVTGVAEGFPFPFPENALELMWNHKLKFRGLSSSRQFNLVAATREGDFQAVTLRIDVLSQYHQPGATLETIDNRLLYFLQAIESPPRLAGTLLLVHDSVNHVAQPRTAWTYNPSQRRVIRAPNVAYDNPAVATDGLAVSDMADMFNGATDRFDWTLLGRREMFVPYNAYTAHASDLEFDGLVQAGHLNPALLRYELHRIWVVEARLREGIRHINPRRTYYLDEDSYQILLADHYDERGGLWRFSEAHSIVFYEIPMLWTSIETHHDLHSGRYVSYRQDNRAGPARFDQELTPAMFSPQALRRRGRR